MIYASYSKLPKKLKNGIEILVGQAVFKLWINILSQNKIVDNFEIWDFYSYANPSQ